ncbi:sensor histidine kinase [Flavobacterium litorale]|uniref:Histidine kinase domain-containing protein n=1 Tax=Flavobacterium litorale TaxID=2856519 RepID=A0ABX8V8P0_9FLAO|nr:sensor histidine kinase [Flavobacterium litorale]QYJ69214.1 hypothetical protein K1I41_04805 [Flavobacterium litorale]
MRFFIRLLLLLLVIGIGKCQAQNSTYRITRYSADSNHLPQNTVKSIIKDKYGYMWLATENGLVRFDGKNFKVFSSFTNMLNTKSDRMHAFGGSIAKDSILIRNEVQDYFLIRNRNVVKDTIAHPALAVPKRKHLKGNVKFTSSLHFSNTTEFFTLCSNGNSYVIGDDSVRVFNKNRALKQAFAHTIVDSTQFFSISGKLYEMKTSNNYNEIRHDTLIHKTFDVPDAKGYCFYKNELANQFFLTVGKNVYAVTHKNGTLQTKLLYNDFNRNDNIIALYFDAKNNKLYMGSENKGLIVAEKQDFKKMASPIRHKYGTDGVYYGLTNYGGNKIISATNDVFENGKHVENINFDGTPDRYAIVFDDNGNLWRKGYSILYKYYKDSNYKKFDHWHIESRITTIIKAVDGKIWIGTNRPRNGKEIGYLYVINPNEKDAAPEMYMKLKHGLMSLRSTSNNELWVGSRTKMHKLNITQQKLTEVAGFNNAYIRNMYSSNPNELWVATYKKGLFLHKDGVTTNFPADKNGYILTANCIIEDAKQHFWVTTNQGLFCVSKQDLLDYALGKRQNIYYHLYDKGAGFATNEFNGGCEPCGVYLSEERIFFPSMEGIIHFEPEETILSFPKNDIFIDEVKVDTATFSSTNLVLNRDFERILFYVSSPYYGNKNNLTIETKLTGPVTQDWTVLNNNFISFSTLPPGKYELIARKLSGFNSNYSYKSITFSITPAFWQTTWFVILVIIGGILIVVGVFKIRLRYIRRKNELLEQQVAVRTTQLSTTISALRKTKDDLSQQNENHIKLIKNITHDIKSPLKFMEITGRYVYNNLSKDDSVLKEDVESIYTSSSQLYHFVDNFLEYTKMADSDMEIAPYPLHKVIEEKIQFFSTIAKSRNTIVTNKVSKDISITTNKHLLAIVLHNLLDNAIKHTKGGSITFNATQTAKTTIITIADTGTGMSAEKLAYCNNLIKGITDGTVENGGMGLLIIVELLVIMGVSMKIDATEGKGTTVTLTL